MLHAVFCAAFSLTLVVASAAEDKVAREETISGTIKKVDPSALRLTIAVKNNDKKPLADREFEFDNTTRFLFFSGAEKKEVTGKQVFKIEQLKEGAEVTVRSDGKGKAIEVRVGAPPRPENP